MKILIFCLSFKCWHWFSFWQWQESYDISDYFPGRVLYIPQEKSRKALIKRKLCASLIHFVSYFNGFWGKCWRLFMKEIEINRNVCLKSDNKYIHHDMNTQKRCIHSLVRQVRFDCDKKNQTIISTVTFLIS